MNERTRIAHETAEMLTRASGSIGDLSAVIGFDGFVDQIIDVVESRTSAESYQPMRKIVDLSDRIQGASGRSANLELVVKLTKLGGNGPIMANALTKPGVKVTYIGNLGQPLDPVFEDFASRARVVSIAQPGYTDALEFKDGKLMLGKHQHLRDVTWENVLAAISLDEFVSIADRADLIAANNWTMLPQMDGIWLGISRDVAPRLSSGKRRTFFCDFADPEKRTVESLRHALKLLQLFEDKFEVSLGLNLKEAVQVIEALEIDLASEVSDDVEAAAVAIRSQVDLACVVIHPRTGASAATRETSATFAGPFTNDPKINTGGGDHFNAGFALARLLGLPLPHCLALGTATSGYYVREAVSPGVQELVDFLQTFPEPEPTG